MTICIPSSADIFNKPTIDIETQLANYRFIEVDGQKGRGWPCKTWAQLVKDDLRS